MVKGLLDKILDLEKDDTNIYRTENKCNVTGQRLLYGGQLMCQALVASCKTKPLSYRVRSLHCHFLRPCQTGVAVIYKVKRIKDGARFVVDLVDVIQKGESVCTVIVSFQSEVKYLAQLSHQRTMPNCTPADRLPNNGELLCRHRHLMTPSQMKNGYIHNEITQLMPIECRPVDAVSYLRAHYAIRIPGHVYSATGATRELVWMRVKDGMLLDDAGGDEWNRQCCLAVYLSDWNFLPTAWLLHTATSNLSSTSLNHSIYFHAQPNTSDWVLYEMTTPRMVEGRALVSGYLWRSDGSLAASVCQEGILYRNSKL